ncbi:MAG TPA: CHAT domain-containing tetratricopeptide repeat protein [Roseiflexaceae bacterium]|nr:CHAT domain-containing tetratricopeptide repeat protein [Roseiflexaceae bacterium]
MSNPQNTPAVLRPLDDPQPLIAWAAVLRWFDSDLLAGLAAGTGNLAGLLDSDAVQPAAEPPGARCLTDAARTAALEQLRAVHPLAEQTLHTRCFDYFLDAMGQPDPARRTQAEHETLYHLDRLFFLHITRRELDTIAGYVAAVRAAGPSSACNHSRLALYDGIIAYHRRDYASADQVLGALLQDPQTPEEVRLRAANTMALAHMDQGHYDIALRHYQQVRELALALDHRYYQAVALINMGMVYHELDQHAQALDLTMQSLEAFRAIGDQARELIALYEIGNNALRLGRWQMADQMFRDAERLGEQLGMEAQLGYVFWGQGLLHHLLGDAQRSEQRYLRAQAIARQPGRSNQILDNDVRWHLAFLYSTVGRWEEALVAYEEAIAQGAQLQRRHWLCLMHYQRGNTLRSLGRAPEAEEAYRKAIEAIETLRGATEGEDLKIGLLGTTQQVYERMVLHCLEQGRPEAAFDYVERARSRAFLDTLASKSLDLYDTFNQPVLSLREVQNQLPAGALLLEYFTVGVLPRGEHVTNMLPPENTHLREQLTLPPEVLIFAVARDHFEMHRVALDPNALRPQLGDPGPGRRFLRPRLLARLHDQLIAPVAHLLDGREVLYLVPHGPLHYLPFAALGREGAPPLLRAGGPALAQAPSATVLLRNCLRAPAAAGAGLLALGYNDEGPDCLTYAEAEARHIAAMFGGAAHTGPEPKRPHLARAASQARWLHIAGHAVFHPADPTASELRLGRGEALQARTIMHELDLRVDLVTLSACTTGLSHVVPGDELQGLPRAFLYAGAPTVVCTLWEAADLVTLLVMERFYQGLRGGAAPAAALRDAQVAVRDLSGAELANTLARWRSAGGELAALGDNFPVIAADQHNTQPFADPQYWAPFMLIGRAE